MKFMPDMVDCHLLIAGTTSMQTQKAAAMDRFFLSCMIQMTKWLVSTSCMLEVGPGVSD